MLRSLFLMAALTLPVVSSQAQLTPSSSPLGLRAGEIALEGAIASLDASKNVLTLRAVSFSTPSGASKKLLPPKLKAVQLGGATQFLEQSGMENLALRDLTKGLSVRVVGREVAGKPFVARVVAWKAPQLVAPDPDTPAIIAPLLPAPQSALGATLRPVDALWTRKSAIDRDYEDRLPTFFTTWKLESAPPTGTDEEGNPLSRASLAQLVKVSGPKGEPLDVMAANVSNAEESGFQKLGFFHDQLDPRWPFITMEWDVRDPRASVPATGHFVSTLQWMGLDFPRKVGEKIAIGRNVTSDQGTTVSLLSVERKAPPARFSAQGEYLYFTFRVLKGSQAPDAQIRLSLSDLSDEKGSYRGSSGGGGYSGDSYNVRNGTVPPDDAGKLKLSVRLVEDAPSLQDRSKYRRLKFQIPVASLWKARPLEIKPVTPLSAENAQIRAQLECIRRRSFGLGAVLWVEDKDDAAMFEGDGRYLLRAASLLSPNGEKDALYFDKSSEDTRFVRESGVMATPGARSYRLSAPAGPLKLSLDFERAQRQRHFATLRDISLPAPGQSQAPDAPMSGGFFVVRRVMRFNDASQLAGLSNDLKKNTKGSGVAVVLGFPALSPGADLDLKLLQISDPEGRTWDSAYSTLIKGDATLTPGENPRFRTLLLPDFGTNTEQISLDLVATETRWENSKKQTLELAVP